MEGGNILDLEKVEQLDKEAKIKILTPDKLQTNIVLTRNVPHVEGNFACLIYLNINTNLGNKFNLLLNSIEQLLRNSLEINKEPDTSKDNPTNDFVKINKSKYHVSLSPTIYLKYHQVNSFLNSLKTKLKYFKSVVMLILSQKITYFRNEYNTSSFVGLEIIKNKQFNKLYLAITEVVESFGFSNSIDIKECIPHISLFSSNKDFNQIVPEEKMRDKISTVFSCKDKGYLKILELKELQIIIGSKLETIKLNI